MNFLSGHFPSALMALGQRVLLVVRSAKGSDDVPGSKVSLLGLGVTRQFDLDAFMDRAPECLCSLEIK
jgi:hypothetical protein